MTVPRSRTPGAAGFTLMEMLVSLVIVALATGLVAQALFQASRLEQRMAYADSQGAKQDLQRLWLRRLLEGLQPVTPLSQDRFQGDADRLRGLSTAVPAFPDETTQRFELRLQRAEDRVRLLLLRGLDSEEQALELLSWTGSEGGFRYLDATGNWQERWPANAGKSAALPRAVALQTGLNPVPLLVVAPLAQGEPPVRRRELEQL